MSLSSTFAPQETDYQQFHTDDSASATAPDSLYNGLDEALRSNSTDKSTSRNIGGDDSAIVIPPSLYSTDDLARIDMIAPKINDGAVPSDKAEGNDKPIDWSEFKDNTVGAYQKALDSGKPLVLVLGEDWCGHCKNMKSQLEDPQLGRFTKDAVFVYASPSKDPAAKLMVEKLGIKGVPAITVLEPNASMIEERGRLSGYFTAQELSANFTRLLNKNPMNMESYAIASAEGDKREG